MKRLFLLCLIFTTFYASAEEKQKKFSFDISGYLNMRVAYEFDGISDCLDMMPYYIPVEGDATTQDKLYFDGTTSRIKLSGTAHTDKIGDIKSYIAIDFRGDGGSYGLRLREFYVEAANFMVGKAFSTFYDLAATPLTIDFAGLNSLSANFGYMIRYTKPLGEKYKLIAAIEMPQISMEPSTYLIEVPQVAPDLILLGERQWGESHLRAGGVVRSLRYYNEVAEDYSSELGWGVQLTSRIKLCKGLYTYLQGLYGEGITAYIQDIIGSGLDLVENPYNQNNLQTLPMYGMYASLQYDFSSAITTNAGYGRAAVLSSNNYRSVAPDTYNVGEYAFANAFYSFDFGVQIGLEYIRGTRKNMDGAFNHANRIQTIVQYNF